MTVAELIAELQKMPQNMQVQLIDSEYVDVERIYVGRPLDIVVIDSSPGLPLTAAPAPE